MRHPLSSLPIGLNLSARFALAVFGSAALFGCAQADLDLDRAAARYGVTDGTPASQLQIGSTVALVEPAYGNEPVCTGTLVAPRVVISAAHCVRWQGQTTNPSDLKIAAGVLQVPGAQLLDVSGVFPHPDFVEAYVPNSDPDGLGNEHDISVITLAADLTSVPSTPILPSSLVDVALYDGALLTISGFGMTSDNFNTAEYGTLYVADTPFERRSDAEFIAGSPGNPDTCSGDSGGPAYVDHGGTRFVVGATSRGKESGTGACGEGGIYTLVSTFEPWIDDVAGDLYPVAGLPVVDPPGDDPADPPDDPPDDTGDPSDDPPATAGSCANNCGGFDAVDDCGCDPACKEFGDCCSDFAEQCEALSGWSCDVDAYADAVCDCGCGATDVDCATLSPNTCERSACAAGQAPSADLASCVSSDDPAPDGPTPDDAPPGSPAAPGDGDPDDGLNITPNGTMSGAPRTVGGCSAAGDAATSPALFGLLLGLVGVARRRRRVPAARVPAAR